MTNVANIARLNDLFRNELRNGLNIRGKIVKTMGIDALSVEDQFAIYKLVENFKDFPKDDDPYGERDFGAFDYKGEKIFLEDRLL